MKRDFKGIWIPKEIWLDKELKPMEKLFLVEINSLDDEENHCFASNEYFADFFSLSKNRCSEIIKTLETKGYIEVKYKYKENSKAIEKRIIKVVDKSDIPIRNSDRPIRFSDRGTRNSEEGYSEKCEDNNTLYNNTINNINNNNIYTPITKSVIDYLNSKIGTSYKHTTKKTKSLISARVNEGFEEKDFLKVIDTKVAEWSNTDMDKYLRPETLFGTKFENYLNQRGAKGYGTSGNNSKDHGINWKNDTTEYNINLDEIDF